MISKFIENQRLRGLEEGTLKRYESDLKKMCALHKEELHQYFMTFSPKTRRDKMSLFKEYQRSNGNNEYENLQPPRKVYSQPPDCLTDMEMTRLIRAARSRIDDPQVYIFIEIGSKTGLRIDEILQLSKHSLENGFIKIKRKGGKIQNLPCPKSIEVLIANFEGFTMNRRSFQRHMHRLGKELGIQKKVNPHVLRHSFATNCVLKGVDLALLKEYLGHSSIMTTMTYTHIKPEHLRKMVDET